MIVDQILNIISGEAYDTGSLRIHYDFTGYSAGKLQNNADYAEHTGLHVAGGNIAPTQTGELSKIVNQGFVFFGGAVNSGNINYNTFEIGNADDINGERFTIILAGGPRNGTFLQGESDFTHDGWASIKDETFSNFPFITNRETGINCADGWEIGVTATNRLYFECQNPDTKRPFSFAHRSNGARDNIWSIVYDSSTLRLGRFDVIEETFAEQSTELSDLLPGQRWTIGSGFVNPYLNNTGFSGNTLLGSLRHFVYIDDALDRDTLNRCGQALYKTNTYETSYVSFTGIESIITGSGLSDISGITVVNENSNNYTGVLSEPFQYVSPLIGSVASGDAYYTFLTGVSGLSAEYMSGETNIYYRSINTGASTTGITGFETYTGYQLLATGYTGILSFTFSSGKVGDDVTFLFSVESGSFFSGSVLVLDTGAPAEYLYPTSRTYLWERWDTGDFCEHNTGNYQDSSYPLHKNGGIGGSNFFPGSTVYLDDDYAQSGVNLYINGVARFASGISVNNITDLSIEYVSGDTFIVRSCTGDTVTESTGINAIVREHNELMYALSADWYLTGIEIIESTAMSDEFVATSEYDINQFGARIQIPIPSTGAHTGLRTSNLEFLFGGELFFNGHKIVSGENYSGHHNGSYTEFRPFGWILESTGSYFLFPSYTGNSFTGKSYDIYNTRMRDESVITWINGIRADSEDFVYHDSRSDMITGGNIFIDNKGLIYG